MARGRGRPRKDAIEMPPPAEEAGTIANFGARRDTIRAAVNWIAERQAEVKALNAEIAEYKQKHIKGDLGFKLADFNAIYRVSQLEVEDRDKLLDTLREGFEALGIGEQASFLDAMETTLDKIEKTPVPRRAQAGNGQVAEPHAIAWETGFADGLAGNQDHAARWPAGEFGHADYHLGNSEGHKRHENDPALAP